MSFWVILSNWLLVIVIDKSDFWRFLNDLIMRKYFTALFFTASNLLSKMFKMWCWEVMKTREVVNLPRKFKMNLLMKNCFIQLTFRNQMICGKHLMKKLKKLRSSSWIRKPSNFPPNQNMISSFYNMTLNVIQHLI